MANVDAPHGLRPVRHLTGGQMRLERVTMISSNALIGIGDPLVANTAGTYDQATAGQVSIGAVAAQPLAASSGGTILCWRDPDIVFEAQTDDGTGVATVQDAMTLNIDYVVAAATFGISRVELNEGSAAVTKELPFKVRGLYLAEDNALGEFNRLEVTINSHLDRGIGRVGL